MKYFTGTLFLLLIIHGCNTTHPPPPIQDFNYLTDNGLDSTAPEPYLLGRHKGANNKYIDTLVQHLTTTEASEFRLDVYPYQLGPQYDENGKEIPTGSENGYSLENPEYFWQLSGFMTIPTLKTLCIYSVCSFDLSIEEDNNSIENLLINSHSCNFINSRRPIKYSNLKALNAVSFRRIDLTANDLEELSKSKTLRSFTANECRVDLAKLLPLKDQLKYLNLTSSIVLNIDLLSEFKNLEVLYAGKIGLDDIGWIGGLKNLRELSVKDSPIKSYDGLLTLKHLQRLYVQNNDIKLMPKEILEDEDIEVITWN